MTSDAVSNRKRVVIVGRPNVGKSSLFNRVLRRPTAIVDSSPGVTRDRLTGEVCWDNRCWTLVDTGGLEITGTEKKSTPLATAIRRQVDAALTGAHLALLVVDGKSGLSGLDAAIADDLRRRAIPTMLVVNKCDHQAAELEAAEFSRIGMIGWPVSAAHGRGIAVLMDAVNQALAEHDGRETAFPAPQTPETKPMRMAVVGRPNVGKSSLINAFLHQERLLVSETPGTTRDSVDVPLTIRSGNRSVPFVLTDTAGLRRKRELESAVESFSIHQAAKAVQYSDLVSLVLEAGKGPTAQDKKIAALIGEHRRAAMILVNKTDTIDAATEKSYRKEILLRLPFMAFCEIVFVSAHSGRNLRQALARAAGLAARINVRLPTGHLNRALELAARRVQPPMVRGIRAKVFYATQTDSNPLRIVLFVNRPGYMPQAYRQFLENQIRRRFPDETAGLPIMFEFRERH